MTMNFEVDTFYNATEPEELILDSNHPGINDVDYIERRGQFFNIAREYRLQNKGLPVIKYSEQEHDIWRTISKELISAHEKHACDIFLEGKSLLNIDVESIPQLRKLDEQLRQEHNMGLVPAEGLIDVKNFFSYLSNRLMPCTQFLRHGKNPAYTPEPDAVHDVIGHIPPLMNKTYTDLVQLIGQGVKNATPLQLQAWQRIYWFTIEFGLIEQKNELKVLGAGLLSSFGEMQHCFSDKVTRKPFVLEEVIEQDYNSNVMQDILFVVPSLEFLLEQVQILIEWFTKK